MNTFKQDTISLFSIIEMLFKKLTGINWKKAKFHMNTFKPLGSFISIAIDEWSDLNKLVFYLWKIKILYWHWVRVIIFPSHTTHVLQPFDVSLASPLKASIKLIGRSFPAHIEKNILFVR